MTTFHDWLIHSPAKVTPTLRLICFPFAGGGAANYLRWRADLRPDIDLYALNLPGRERFFGQPPVTDYAGLIEQLALEISTHADVPLVFFGHSYGGITAYFIVLELQKRGLTVPLHTFISARTPPRVEHHVERMADLDTPTFTRLLIERYQGVPQAIIDHPDLLAIFIPIIQNDFKLYEQNEAVWAKYADPIIHSDVTSIGFLADTPSQESLQLWSHYVAGRYQHFILPGGHFEVLNHWMPVLERINGL